MLLYTKEDITALVKTWREEFKLGILPIHSIPAIEEPWLMVANSCPRQTAWDAFVAEVRAEIACEA